MIFNNQDSNARTYLHTESFALNLIIDFLILHSRRNVKGS